MSDIRDVSSLPIAANLIDKLHAHGFRLVSDLQGVKPLDLAQEIGIAPALAMTVIRAASGCLSQSTQLSQQTNLSTSTTTTAYLNSASTVFSAKELVARMSIQRPIITFCKALDTMLGGGVSIGHVTEICGVPGIGKTQLLCQFALNVQIPEVFHGLGGETLFLDTEGTFFPERVAEMAHELSKHLMKMAQHTAQRGNHVHNAELIRAQLQAAESMTMERFLTGIHVVRCHDTSDIHVFLHHLTAFLSLHPAVRLIVIDSIAFPFRAMGSIPLTGTGGSGSVGGGSAAGGSGVSGASGIGGSNSGYTVMERQRQLAALAQRLSEVAFQYNCAVVVSNHVTTRIAPTTSSGAAGNNVDMDSATSVPASTSSLVPALGDTWAHAITTRLLLHWDHSGLYAMSNNSHQRRQRVATLVKSPAMPLQSVAFVVNKKGIRDVPSTAAVSTANHAPAIAEQQQQQQQEERLHAQVAHQMQQIIGSKRSHSGM